MDEPAPNPLSQRFKLDELIDGLADDLKLLRAGKISVREANARALLAKQILRGVHYVVVAQKFLAGQAKLVPPDGSAPTAKPEGRKRRAV